MTELVRAGSRIAPEIDDDGEESPFQASQPLPQPLIRLVPTAGLAPVIPLSNVSANGAPAPRFGSNSADLLSPDDDPGPYDLLADLRKPQFAGAPKEALSLYGFPAYLTVNIRRVLARNRSHRGDWAQALSSLLWAGLKQLSALPAAKDLAEALHLLDTDDDLSAIAAEQVELWRRGFRFQPTDPTHTMGLEKSRKFKVPEPVHTSLFETASRIGMSGSSLGILCIMSALSGQAGVLSDHREHMRRVVEDLEHMIGERERRLRGLVKSIQGGVWR